MPEYARGGTLATGVVRIVNAQEPRKRSPGSSQRALIYRVRAAMRHV